MSIAEKRKTYTSSAVKKRYNDKTYRSYHLTLRMDSEGELIEKLDALISAGMSQSEAIKTLLDTKQKADNK